MKNIHDYGNRYSNDYNRHPGYYNNVHHKAHSQVPYNRYRGREDFGKTMMLKGGEIMPMYAQNGQTPKKSARYFHAINL